ncbi:MAG: glycosyltransferase [Planctomycetes bacterium]|nr:glycosyltransferase [Planctomycetota bacterium]
MKLLLVSRGFPPRGRWGTEFYTHQLARGLAARGHEVAILHAVRDRTRPRGTIDVSESDGFRVFVIANPPDPAKPLADSYRNATVESAFDALLERERFELVHFNYLLWGLSVRLPEIARARGVPNVVTLTDFGLLCHRGQMFDWHSRDCGGPHPPATCARCIREPSSFDAHGLELLTKRVAVRAAAALGGAGRVVTAADVAERERTIAVAARSIDRFIAPTRALAEVFVRAGFERARIEELTYAFDETPFIAARAEPTDALVRIAFLGQYAPHKGPHVLLDAVKLMARRLPESVEPWRVEFYGDSAGERYRDYVGQAMADADERVAIHASIEHAEVPELFRHLSAIVVPSLWMENAPFAALQARAAGVPIVASDVRGLAEVVEAPRFGDVFPPSDALALANVLRDVVLRKRRRVKEPGLALGFAAHVDRIEAVYARVREENSRR